MKDELTTENMRLLRIEMSPGATVTGDMLSFYPSTINRLMNAAREEARKEPPAGQGGGEADLHDAAERVDAISYTIRRGETDDQAFRRAAHAEVARLRQALAAPPVALMEAVIPCSLCAGADEDLGFDYCRACGRPRGGIWTATTGLGAAADRARNGLAAPPRPLGEGDMASVDESAASSNGRTEAEPTGFPQPGDQVFFLGRNGYPDELARAKEVFRLGENLTVADIDIGDWRTTLTFHGAAGRWNSVMFDRVFSSQHPHSAGGEG